MRVAITGASGFIGSALVPVLTRGGHDVRIVRLRSPSWAASIEGCEAVVHLAAIAHSRAPAGDALQRANVELPVAVGRAAASAGAHMVFLSSTKVYGEESQAPLDERSPLAPRDAYGRAKLEAEEGLSAVAGLRLTVVRPPLVYGEGVKANFLALLRLVARGWPLPFASIVNRRSFLYVGNLCDAVATCLARPPAGFRSYVAADRPALSTPQLCSTLASALGVRVRLFPFPPRLLEMHRSLRALTRSMELDDSRLRTELGWRPPYTLEQGLRATGAWYRGR